MRETGKKREELKASRPKRNFINEEDLKLKTDYNVSCGGFYSQPLIQNTKKIKSKSYYRGQNEKKTKKKEQISKKVKSRTSEQWRMKGQFSQPVKFCRLRKFCSPAPFLSFAFYIAALSSS